MRLQIKTLAVIFSVVLNIAFLTVYVARKVADRPKYAYEEVNLSKEQHVQMVASRDHFLKAINEIGYQIINANVGLADLIAADPPDQQAIEGRLQKIGSLQQSMQQVVVTHLLEDKQILTPKQRARFFAVIKSRIRAQAAPWLAGRSPSPKP
jgi:Spy/CpxP family protein refolding chaperone